MSLVRSFLSVLILRSCRCLCPVPVTGAPRSGISGESIQFDPATRYIVYPRALRENNDSIEAGFCYKTSKRQVRYGFYSSTVFDGANTDKKFAVGGFVEIPFQVSDDKGK